MRSCAKKIFTNFSRFFFFQIINIKFIVISKVPHINSNAKFIFLFTDFMQPQMERIFSQNTFQKFKTYLDHPDMIADYLWSSQTIEERQYQEIKSCTTDIAKAEYFWLLMKRGRPYLEAVRKALIDTEQKGIADLLEYPSRCVLCHYHNINKNINSRTLLNSMFLADGRSFIII